MTTLLDHKRRESIRLVLNASDYLAVFGGYATVTAERINRTYRNLARIVHPDVNPGNAEATEAFQKLNQLKADADQMLITGRWGERVILATIRTRKAVHKIIRKSPFEGDITTLYEAKTQRDGDPSVASLLKVAKSARDNSLLAAEAKALKTLNASDEKWTRHYPRLLDTFAYSEGRRRSNVTAEIPGAYSIEWLHSLFLPGEMNPLHGVWMFRRLLMALGFAHDNGIIHGAVLPRHVLILPEDHGVILTDWCHSSIDGGRVLALKRDEDWLPEEVVAKQSPSPATDIVMAARTIIYILGGDPIAGTIPTSVPRPFRAFLKGCLQTKQAMRPQNAWVLLREFDDALNAAGAPFVPRRFIDFAVPTA